MSALLIMCFNNVFVNVVCNCFEAKCCILKLVGRGRWPRCGHILRWRLSSASTWRWLCARPKEGQLLELESAVRGGGGGGGVVVVVMMMVMMNVRMMMIMTVMIYIKSM
jgi:hypothetical protein